MTKPLPDAFLDDLENLCVHHTSQGCCTGCLFRKLLQQVEAYWRGAVDSLPPQQLLDVLAYHGIRYNGERLLDDIAPTDFETTEGSLH
jgi:hypothetical protein